MNDYAIRVENLGKRYKIGSNAGYKMLRDTLQDSFESTFRALLPTSRSAPSKDRIDPILWALKDVSFEVQKGESVGIIGSNGAGKSTLLKILSHITAPTTGRVRLRGRVGSLLEVGTGFHPELTGRENIFLNGAILGMRKREIESRFDEIVEFSEMEKFLDTPVKFYSSGMRMRLAFSVAAHLEPEILLIDEVLAVGDMAFQKKSLNKMNDVVKEGRTVLFVSHNMAAIRSLCNSAIYLEHGMVKFNGELSEAIDAYLTTGEVQQAATVTIEPDESAEFQVLSVSVLDADGQPSFHIPHDQPFCVRIQVAVRKKLFRTLINLRIEDDEMDIVVNNYDFHEDESRMISRDPGLYTYEVHVPAPLLVPGKYRLTVTARHSQKANFQRLEHICPFELFDNGSVVARAGTKWKGKIFVPLHWECNEFIPYDIQPVPDNTP